MCVGGVKQSTITNLFHESDIDVGKARKILIPTRKYSFVVEICSKHGYDTDDNHDHNTIN
jgi:hypothetical protein